MCARTSWYTKQTELLRQRTVNRLQCIMGRLDGYHHRCRCWHLLGLLRIFLGWLKSNQDASKGQAEPCSWCLGNERGFHQQFWRQWYPWPSPPMQPWRASCELTKMQEDVPEAQTLQLDGAQWNNQHCRGRRRVDHPWPVPQPQSLKKTQQFCFLVHFSLRRILK